VSHSVLVKISRPEKKGGKVRYNEVLSVTGKIREVHEVDEGHIKVLVDCIQFDEQSWKDLVSLYSNRQDEINKFLETVKP
ncbi:hypothetical protein LOX66_19970, partial [Bacillus velezensis]|uniref:hypothetical protein n=1 Tax=Bacillus velezensis TaxID=492670 RepID=UPI001E51262F